MTQSQAQTSLHLETLNCSEARESRYRYRTASKEGRAVTCQLQTLGALQVDQSNSSSSCKPPRGLYLESLWFMSAPSLKPRTYYKPLRLNLSLTATELVKTQRYAFGTPSVRGQSDERDIAAADMHYISFKHGAASYQSQKSTQSNDPLQAKGTKGLKGVRSN